MVTVPNAARQTSNRHTRKTHKRTEDHPVHPYSHAPRSTHNKLHCQSRSLTYRQSSTPRNARAKGRQTRQQTKSLTRRQRRHSTLQRENTSDFKGTCSGAKIHEPEQDKPHICAFPATTTRRKKGKFSVRTLIQTYFQVEPESAICVQNFDDSLNPAIRITYRSSQRSSSMCEPRHPLLKVAI